MPMLDFECQDCHKKFDELVNAHNRDELRCPVCGSAALKRIYQGKCLFGGKATGASSGCAGNCAHCAGCH